MDFQLAGTQTLYCIVLSKIETFKLTMAALEVVKVDSWADEPTMTRAMAPSTPRHRPRSPASL